MSNWTHRLTKLTPEVRESICNFVRQGIAVGVAANLNALSDSTISLWMKRGREELHRLTDPEYEINASEAPFVKFYQDVQCAKAEAERTMVSMVRAAAPNDWRAAAWYLERNAPSRWGRRDKVAMLTLDQIEAEIARLESEGLDDDEES